MSNNIYRINDLLYRALEASLGEVDEETGIVFDNSLIEQLEVKRDEKIEGALLYAEEKEAEADLIKKRAKAMTDYANTLYNSAERSREYALNEIGRFGDTKFISQRIRATVCESKSVDIKDESLLPDEVFKVTRECSKEFIKQLLKSGQKVPGAEFKTSKYLRIK